MLSIISILLIVTALAGFLIISWAGLVSLSEKEPRAARWFFFLSVLAPLPYLFLAFADFPYHSEIGIGLLVITYGKLFIFFVPAGKNKSYRQPVPAKQIDERDTMFSRNELKPGTIEFDEYYKNNPGKKNADDRFRKKPGLLKPGTTQYNPFHFASADASFETIEELRSFVDGTISGEQVSTEPEKITRYIKSWSKKLGAVDFGVTELKKYHLYSVGGRAERRNKPVVNNHKYAIAFTVEMDRAMIASAPRGTVVMESGQQYLESGKIALQVAAFIRKLGYEARAHIDGNYQVVCPLVARDAGLGEIGRMGLLMTPKLGPRVRISVVTTNLPLITDKPLHEYSMIDFCEKCKKCAGACPSKAISFDTRTEIGGVRRWQINQEACFTLWCNLGTDCARCISVCPFSHPDNTLHNVVRFGIKNSSLFRIAALKLDNAFYGRKPATAPLPGWTEI